MQGILKCEEREGGVDAEFLTAITEQHNSPSHAEAEVAIHRSLGVAIQMKTTAASPTAA